MNIEQIAKILPHRYPFLLIDRITELENGKHAKGIKNVTSNEPHFQGHFPKHKIMPGVLILEAMAQISAILAASTSQISNAPPKSVYLVGVDHARFRQIVIPGDTLILESKILQQRGIMWKFETLATVQNKVVASASISAMTESNSSQEKT
jgi:3-hydroxyacyl-[acyl-carrier-protein] dehydratase